MRKELLKKIAVSSALVAAVAPVGVQIANPIVAQASGLTTTEMKIGNYDLTTAISTLNSFVEAGDTKGAYNFLTNELGFESLTEAELNSISSERGLTSATIKLVKEVIQKNWKTIAKLLPAWVTLDKVFEIIDTYLGFSDTIEQGLVNVFMALGLSESVSSFVAKTIMLLLPI